MRRITRPLSFTANMRIRWSVGLNRIMARVVRLITKTCTIIYLDSRILVCTRLKNYRCDNQMSMIEVISTEHQLSTLISKACKQV